MPARRRRHPLSGQDAGVCNDPEAALFGFDQLGRVYIHETTVDLTTPGMNGFEVLAELRRRGDSPPVIIVTAHADPATRSRAAAAGALGLVEKPHRSGELLALVRRALGIGV